MNTNPSGEDITAFLKDCADVFSKLKHQAFGDSPIAMVILAATTRPDGFVKDIRTMANCLPESQQQLMEIASGKTGKLKDVHVVKRTLDD